MHRIKPLAEPPNLIGKNNADNNIDTNLVTANENGSVLERIEWIQVALGGTSGQLRVQQSVSSTAEEGSLVQFSISLMNIQTGAIPSADIDIAGISQSMKRSRSGGAFTPITDPEVVFAKADGQVYFTYEFKDAQWDVGDVYKLTVSGIFCTIDGDTAYVPQVLWSNMVVSAGTLTGEVAKIPKSDSNVTWNATALASIKAEADTALNSQVPASPNAGALTDILSKAAPGNTFNKSTDSLEAIRDFLDDNIGSPSTRANFASIEQMLGFPDSTDGSLYSLLGGFTGTDSLRAIIGNYSAASSLKDAIDALSAKAGSTHIVSTDIDLNQAAGTYTLFTGSVAPSLLKSISVKMPEAVAGGALTSIKIHTDATTEAIIIDEGLGTVGNLTEGADLAWVGNLRIVPGAEIQLTIAGGATGTAYAISIVAEYMPINDGGVLII